jgi:hypothetical protein
MNPFQSMNSRQRLVRAAALAALAGLACGCGEMRVPPGDRAATPAAWSATTTSPQAPGPSTPVPADGAPVPGNDDGSDANVPDVPDNPNAGTRPVADPNRVADPNVADPNGMVASFPPSGPIAVDANAMVSFDPNMLDPTDPNQYPVCLTCYTRSFTAVPGCPAEGIGTSLPCEAFCHLAYSAPTNNYSTNPPASGPHYPSPEHVLGEHTSPVPRGRYVHSMEHGAIILAYNCPSGCAAELGVLRQVLAARTGYWDQIIMTPDPLMTTTRFAAIAWTWAYTFDTPDLAALLCFVDQHENHGRENKHL